MMRRVAIVRLLLKRNGLRWLIFFACAKLVRRVSAALNRGLESFERSHSLPGFYDAEARERSAASTTGRRRKRNGPHPMSGRRRW